MRRFLEFIRVDAIKSPWSLVYRLEYPTQDQGLKTSDFRLLKLNLVKRREKNFHLPCPSFPFCDEKILEGCPDNNRPDSYRDGNQCLAASHGTNTKYQIDRPG